MSCAALLEILPGPVEHAVLEIDHRAKIDALGRKTGRRQIAVGDEAAVAQELGTDQQRVSRKSRKALIGRIAKTRRPQWQDLPPLLLGLHERIDPGIGDWPEIADAVGPWKGCRMQNDAGAARRRFLVSPGHANPLTVTFLKVFPECTTPAPRNRAR